MRVFFHRLPPAYKICYTFQANKANVHNILLFAGVGDALNSLHVLSLLKDVLGDFPKSSVKSVCETILKVMTVSNVVSCQQTCRKKINNLESEFENDSVQSAQS